MEKGACSVSDCETKQYAKKVCRKHYLSFIRNGRLEVSQDEVWVAERKICSIDECDSVSSSRDMCTKHYTRWSRYGDPLISSNPTSTWLTRTVEERFWEKVTKTDKCWVWGAYTDRNGYGKFTLKTGSVGAHRFSYALHQGINISDIDDSMVDHRCHNPSCVRPQHLRQATAKQNGEHKRAASKRSQSGIRGVSWHKPSGKWLGNVGHKGKVYHVGLFTEIAEAEAAVKAKRLELHTYNDQDRGIEVVVDSK